MTFPQTLAARILPDNPSAAPLQQFPTSPYWNQWSQLPDWLKPSSTNPHLIFMRLGHSTLLRNLITGGSLFNHYIAALLLNHYLDASGSPYYINSQEVIGNPQFVNPITSFLGQQAALLFNTTIKQQINGFPASSYPRKLLLPLRWTFQSRFGDNMEYALGTATVNPGGNATVEYLIVPDPNNPKQGIIQVTIHQEMELYDRYDWKGTPIGYDSQNDLVAVPSDGTTPVLILNRNQQIVATHPPGTDIRILTGFTYIQYPPDSPDFGAANRLYLQKMGGSPTWSLQVFGGYDHPFLGFAGNFHALEANGEASAFDVYSRWSYQASYTISYGTDASGNIIATGDLTAAGSPQYIPSNHQTGQGYTPTYTPPQPLYPQH